MKRAVLALLLTIASTAHADDRHASTVSAFRKLYPCPLTGKAQRTCPGYVVDHVIPLCAGGPDAVENMAFQTVAASYKKDVLERAICRRLALCPAPIATPEIKSPAQKSVSSDAPLTKE